MRQAGIAVPPSAQRRRPRRAADVHALPDGDDFRAERRRHQPFAERAHPVGGLREWGERLAANGASAGFVTRGHALRANLLPIMKSAALLLVAVTAFAQSPLA